MEDDDQKFCLRWNEFRNSVTAVFEELRQDEELVDITLCCEGKKVKAHRMMLSACSPYFRDLLKENPCQHPVFFLKDTTYDDLRAVIEFVYNGEVNVTRAKISSFLSTAEMLQVRGLTGDDDKASASAPASPRTRQRPASPAAPSPVSRPPSAPVRRPMVPADPPPPPPPPPPVNSVAVAGRTVAPPAESPPVSPATKRRRLVFGSGSGSNDGLETFAAAASAASPAATPPSASVGAPPLPPPPLTEPVGSGFAHSVEIKVEQVDIDTADEDDEDMTALEHVEVDYEESYESNQSLGAIPVCDASQGEEASPTLPEDDPLREPFTHGWRRLLVYRNNVGRQGCKCDCYYLTPTGKKLRSMREIKTILEETDSRIPIGCFSLKRRLVGVGPPHEIERQARIAGGISSPRWTAPIGT